jgi:predicted nicotinamide N-methyase
MLLRSDKQITPTSSPKTNKQASIELAIDILYAAPQAHGIINVTLHREYSLGIVFIFSQGRKDLCHV